VRPLGTGHPGSEPGIAEGLVEDAGLRGAWLEAFDGRQRSSRARRAWRRGRCCCTRVLPCGAAVPGRGWSRPTLFGRPGRGGSEPMRQCSTRKAPADVVTRLRLSLRRTLTGSLANNMLSGQVGDSAREGGSIQDSRDGRLRPLASTDRPTALPGRGGTPRIGAGLDDPPASSFHAEPSCPARLDRQKGGGVLGLR